MSHRRDRPPENPGDSCSETLSIKTWKVASSSFRYFVIYSILAKVQGFDGQVGIVLAAMERVRKTFFNPLATSKASVRDMLHSLPVGSAHPFSPERVLLCRTDNGIDEIDISSYPEDFFFNAVDLGEMGETILRRMAGFPSHLKGFEDFQILQAPAATFKVPIVSGQITILAVSERTPTYYDFCFADESFNTCCWLERHTFSGIAHSGDILNGKDLLDYVRIDKDSLTEKEICVFISGYQSTQITRFLGTHPALLVADHVDKVLYIIPVPLDAATIGDATICCPLVIKRDQESLICSILPTATTDREMMCSSRTLVSPCFPEAIKRAGFRMPTEPVLKTLLAQPEACPSSKLLDNIMTKEYAVLTTAPTTLPNFLDLQKTQIIRFGTGLEFKISEDTLATPPSTVVLPCIFGSLLQGPGLLALGTVPSNMPFSDENALRNYYEHLKGVVVVANDRMTDNARNLATPYRINALFIVQLSPEATPSNPEDIISLLNSANINIITALAGPQSLILVQISDKYYFYRGLANRAYLNTSGLAFGSDVTSVVKSAAIYCMTDPRVKRIINLDKPNTIILPSSGQLIKPHELRELLERLPITEVEQMREDIYAAVPQLQILLNQKDLQRLSEDLVCGLSGKASAVTAELRNAYVEFLGQEYKAASPELAQKKNQMLGDLRKATKETQKRIEPIISGLANMMSSQTTSRRTHDLKRLVRQTQIKGNVEAAKSMTFETLAGYLETYAGDMGVMLLNIESAPYHQLLANLKGMASVNATPCCELDSRVLHLEGFDAGIILEQSQNHHDGPLRSQSGPSRPTLALPYLSQRKGPGSMLAWVCWDEFVNLESPYTVRWMEKCNEAHIAALRIITRDTLSHAVASREHNLQPGSPETGHLMSALLMVAMSKLAAMRITTPAVMNKAEDTVTKLMRGLFGNLLTIAGSGVRPLSMVWQLFGLNPQYDLPTTDTGWTWYETAVALYPYTGWPSERFYENLQNLLDKAIVRVVTKAEDQVKTKSSRTADLIKYCKLRNIQLDHSRTIMTIFMKMLTAEGVDPKAVAGRLLEHLPQKLETQTQSYGKMMAYITHLAKEGERRANDDLIAASVFTKRSAAFSECKQQVSDACQSSDWRRVKEFCQALIDKRDEIAAIWHVKPSMLKVQNLKAYEELLEAEVGENMCQDKMSRIHEITRLVLGDAERQRVPWQVGKPGQFSETIEPLDETLLHEILTGEKAASLTATLSTQISGAMAKVPEARGAADEFLRFKTSLQPGFITAMQQNLSPADICGILNIPVSAMRVFVESLNPQFVWGDLGRNFKVVILGLLENRSNRPQSHPIRKLLELGPDQGMLRIEKDGNTMAR